MARADPIRPHAWRYRDYVIRSFNADKPYDRFLLEQIVCCDVCKMRRETPRNTGYPRRHKSGRGWRAGPMGVDVVCSPSLCLVRDPKSLREGGKISH